MMISQGRREGQTFGKHDVNTDEDQRMRHDVLSGGYDHELKYGIIQLILTLINIPAVTRLQI